MGTHLASGTKICTAGSDTCCKYSERDVLSCHPCHPQGNGWTSFRDHFARCVRADAAFRSQQAHKSRSCFEKTRTASRFCIISRGAVTVGRRNPAVTSHISFASHKSPLADIRGTPPPTGGSIHFIVVVAANLARIADVTDLYQVSASGSP